MQSEPSTVDAFSALIRATDNSRTPCGVRITTIPNALISCPPCVEWFVLFSFSYHSFNRVGQPRTSLSTWRMRLRKLRRQLKRRN